MTVEVPEELLRHNRKLAELLDQRDSIHAEYTACKNRVERESKWLYTAKGCIDSVIHDIKCCVQVFAARPVDPNTLVIKPGSISIQEEFFNGSFKSVMELDLFKSHQYIAFRSRVREAEDRMMGFMTSAQDQVFVNQLHQQFETTLHQQMDMPLRFQHQIMQDMALMRQEFSELRKHSSSPSALTTLPQSGTATNSTASHAIPVELPLSPNNDTVQDGSRPQVIQRAISEHHALLAEHNVDPSNIRIRFCNRDFNTRHRHQYERLIEEYRMVWRPLELTIGNKWHVDRPIETTKGEIMTCRNARCMVEQAEANI
jgi:hypothetical protein